MKGIRPLPAASRVDQPWKNGGGTTQEVASFPPASGMEAFGWRLSVAEVRSEGPFSCFPEIDRTLAVLDGTMELDIAGVRRELRADDREPAAFPGDVPVYGRPIGGPVRDLNLMVRRGEYSAHMSRSTGGRHALDPSGTTILLAAEPVVATCLDDSYSLDCLDALLVSHGEHSVSISGKHYIVVIKSLY